MNTYKKIDVIIQLLLILVITVFFALSIGFDFHIVIVLLGAVQLTSTVIHWVAFPQFRKSMSRKIYYWLLLMALLFALFIFVITVDTSWDELAALAYFTFYTLGMALFYFFICLSEVLAASKNT